MSSIIDVELPKIDGEEEAGVIDASINIGTSASPSTATLVYEGLKGKPPINQEFKLEIAGFTFYGMYYSHSVSDGASGITSTIEYVDLSWKYIDRYYVDLNVSDGGETLPSSEHPARANPSGGDFMFVGSEYYSFLERSFVWDGGSKSWEQNPNKTVGSSMLKRSAYLSFYGGRKALYKRYQNAIKSIENQEALTGGSAGESQVCSGDEAEPADVLLMNGGPFSGQSAQSILNFPSLPNPNSERGQFFYSSSDLKGQLETSFSFYFDGLQNATGPLRSVISSCLGSNGRVWFWDPSKPGSMGFKSLSFSEFQKMPGVPAQAASFTEGSTRANSFSDGVIHKRYIPGKEVDPASRQWKWSTKGMDGDAFSKITSEYDIQEPDAVMKQKAILMLELGEDVYKALWITIDSPSVTSKYTALEQAILKQKVIAGNEQLAALIDGGFNRDGTTEVSGNESYELSGYNKEDWEEELENVRSAMKWVKLWISCGWDESDSSNEGHAKHPYMEYMRRGGALNPELKQVLINKNPDKYGEPEWEVEGYYPVTQEVVLSENSCVTAGSATIYNTDTPIKDSMFASFVRQFAEDSACDGDDGLLDQTIREALDISDQYIVVADNSTWTYEFPECMKEIVNDWAEESIIETNAELGPMELGLDVTTYNFMANINSVAVKKIPTEINHWDKILPDWSSLIKSEPVEIVSSAALPAAVDPMDGLFSSRHQARLCSNGLGKANWGVQIIDSGEEITNDTLDELAGAESICIDETPTLSYTIVGQVEQDISTETLDSISLTFGSSGISATYSFSFKKAIPPTSTIIEGYNPGGRSANVNLGAEVSRFSTSFKGKAFNRQAPPPRMGSYYAVKRGKGSNG